MMDTLSKILNLLHFDSTFYFATNYHAPWSIDVPDYKKVARFHYVTQGICWVRIEGEEPLHLSAGDLIIIPHGVNHILSDKPDRPPISLDEAVNEANYNGEGLFAFGAEMSPHDTQLVCGHFEFDDSFNHPLVEYLPKYIIRNENDGMEYCWLKDTLRFMSHTATADIDGSHAIIKRLSEVIFIQAVRMWHKDNAGNKGFIAALNDPQLSKGLKAFHDDYAASWTVEKLAEASHMSRSLFSERFKQYLDLSPMQYVTHWRMQNARQLLVNADTSIENISLTVGYDSVAAFSKAFKRIFNQNPGQYRRLALTANTACDKNV